jgi:hypothetical protein
MQSRRMVRNMAQSRSCECLRLDIAYEPEAFRLNEAIDGSLLLILR